MLVLLFLMIFNILFAVDLFAFKIEGDVDKNLEKTVMKYYEKNGVNEFDRFLKNIGVDNYTLVDNKLIIGKDYKIRKISIKGNIIFLDSTIKRISGLREGISFKGIDLNRIKENIERYYVDNGYAAGHVKEIFYKDGVVVIDIYEGKLYIVDRVLVESEGSDEKKIPFLKFTADKKLRLPTIAGIDITPMLYNKYTVKYYAGKLRILLNKHGYFESTIDHYTEKSKINHPFINRKVPISSILSILPFFHQSVNLIFHVNYGPKYELIINGIDDNKKDEITDIVYKNIVDIDTFNIRETEYKIQNILLNNLYMKPTANIKIVDNKMLVNISYQKIYDNVEYKVKFKKHENNSFIDKFVKNNKLAATRAELAQNLADFIKSNLLAEGYYTPLVNIRVRVKNNILYFEGDVDEGDVYRIDDIYVNGKIFKKNLRSLANTENMKQVKKMVEEELTNTYMLFSLDLIDQKIIKDKGVISLFFKADVREVFLQDIYIYKKLVFKRMVERYFKKDRKITNDRISKVRETLKKQPQINAYNIRPVNYDNKTTDLVLYTEEAPKNQVYGSIGYDNVDKLRFDLGYRRKNFLNSLHTLEVMGGISTKEEKFGISLVGFDVLGERLNDIFSYGFRDRDEDEYEYMSNRFNLGVNKFGDKYFLGTTIFYENLDIRDTDFTQDIEDKFQNKYDNMGLDIDFKYFMVDDKLNPMNGAVLNIKLTPVNFFKESDFYKSETILTLYKDMFNKILLISRGEFGAIAGKNKDIPLPYRFTLGGPSKMKAFDYRDIGTEDREGNVYGGKYYFYSIIYGGYNIVPLTYIGPFFEIGSAFDNFNDIETFHDAGLMLDLKSNVGSFILSYAVNTKNSKKSKRAFYITFETTF